LAENSRLGRLQNISKAFLLIMNAHKGEVKAKVRTAKPMDAAQLKELKTVLSSFLKAGSTLQLETEVDPSLIGGLVVELADRYVDLSISSKLKKYSDIVKETV
jgi:F-type H+-transporting ATPase subunit O